jgi:hypothetical protein
MMRVKKSSSIYALSEKMYPSTLEHMNFAICLPLYKAGVSTRMFTQFLKSGFRYDNVHVRL